MKLPPVLLAALSVLAAEAARAETDCRIGDVCELQSALLGCRDASLIKRWIDLYVEESREAAEQFLAEQTAAGQCQRFKAGEKLRVLRYLGLRRLEAQRPGDARRYILLLN